MAGNTFGELYRVTTFGESHGAAIGVVIDGCPPGVALDMDFITLQLTRRKPGQSSITTQRSEGEKVEVLSGLAGGVTTGTPLAILVRNEDQRRGDYEHLKDTYRPSHADYTYEKKYGIRDHSGGGRASARETVARVIGGAVARIILRQSNITVQGYVSQVGGVVLGGDRKGLDLGVAETNMVRCPYGATAELMIRAIEEAKEEGDTLGGVVSCVIKGVPAGLGEPVFDKLHADLGKGMLSINAVKGFEIGSGFGGAGMKGSEHNDIFYDDGGVIRTKTNHSGGIQGGISNGEEIFMRVAFKPVSTIMKDQRSVNRDGEGVEIKGKGRHDACVVPRAVAIVEAMAAIVILDHLLRNKATRM